MDDHLSERAGILENHSCALFWLDEDNVTPSNQYQRYILPLVSTWWPRLSSLLSLMPLCLEISSTLQVKNKSSDLIVLTNLVMLAPDNTLHLLISGSISSMFSFMMANDPPCWPHSDPVDYCTSFDDCSIFRLNDYAVRLYVYITMCLKCQMCKHCP